MRRQSSPTRARARITSRASASAIPGKLRLKQGDERGVGATRDLERRRGGSCAEGFDPDLAREGRVGLDYRTCPGEARRDDHERESAPFRRQVAGQLRPSWGG